VTNHDVCGLGVVLLGSPTTSLSSAGCIRFSIVLSLLHMQMPELSLFSRGHVGDHPFSRYFCAIRRHRETQRDQRVFLGYNEPHDCSNARMCKFQM
jgi:hypothetical protein